MSYLETFELELRALLRKGDNENTVTFAKQSVLKSYRNGVERGEKKKERKETSPSTETE